MFSAARSKSEEEGIGGYRRIRQADMSMPNKMTQMRGFSVRSTQSKEYEKLRNPGRER
jgi:hypothetical protein